MPFGYKASTPILVTRPIDHSIIVDVSGIAQWLFRAPPEASMLAERRQLAVLLDAAACVRLACYTLL